MELAKLFLFEKNQILCSSELNLYNEIHKGQVKKIKTLNCFEDQYLYTKQNDEILKLKEKLIQELKKIMPALTPKHS